MLTADALDASRIGYGTGHIRVNSVRPWAWIFIVNGTATILGGVLFLILSPDSPETAHFLSTKEREVALQRVATNQSSLHTNKLYACAADIRYWQADDVRHSKLYQFVEAVNPLADIQAWLLTLSVFALTIANGGLGTYLHIILTAYGFTGFQAVRSPCVRGREVAERRSIDLVGHTGRILAAMFGREHRLRFAETSAGSQ